MTDNDIEMGIITAEYLNLVIIGDQEAKGTLLDACEWYVGFLEAKFDEVWTTLLRGTLVGLHIDSPYPQGEDLSIVYDFMIRVAHLLEQHKELALTDVVDDLANHDLLKESDEERSLPKQLIFAAIGWLSALYQPEKDPPRKKLQVMRNLTTAREEHTHFESKTFDHYTRNLDFDDQPLVRLLRQFGDLIPDFKGDARTTQALGGGVSPFSEYIELSHVSFDMILNFAKNAQSLSLSLLLQNHVPQAWQRIVAVPSDNDHTSEFFREVLLSYRLIFGQQPRAWRAFNKSLKHWDKSWHCSPGNAPDADPMLTLLCGQSWEDDAPRKVYNEIDAEDPYEHYIPHVSFPFLGQRILEVQNFVQTRNAHRLSALWYDRRNVSFWWTFWAVLLFGGLAVILSLFQLVFQIWQVVLAQQQLQSSG
ncbi:hypothetical protein MMC18_005915 [Xylographa bjoerkii]|nr:hypothetical protein [Xylographa bjoerkii]